MIPPLCLHFLCRHHLPFFRVSPHYRLLTSLLLLLSFSLFLRLPTFSLLTSPPGSLYGSGSGSGSGSDVFSGKV
jgi:hypothetical protein